MIKVAIKSFSFKKSLIFTLVFFVIFKSFGQDDYSSKGFIGTSNQNNKNINNQDGTSLQDLKRSTGHFYIAGETSDCSCTLLNNVIQNGTAYVSTAEHCVKNFDVDRDINGFFSFDYEIVNATNRGNPDSDESICGTYSTKFRILFKDKTTDTALLELTTVKPELLRYAYAAGWDNTITNSLWSNISHPSSDHKKVFIKPKTSSLDYSSYKSKGSDEVISIRQGFFYKIGNIWNDVTVPLEAGASGSGAFSNSNLLKGVFTQVFPTYSRISAISNKWYGQPSETSFFSKYLDPNSTWLNSIPGGYINDLVPLDENFNLEIIAHETLETPFPTENATSLPEDVLWIKPSNFFANLGMNEKGTIIKNLPIWTKISGIKVADIANSDLVLSVFYLNQEETNSPFTERLLYGTHVNSSSDPKAPTEFGFKGDSWDCDNLPTGYPPCNRIRIGNFKPVNSNSQDFKRYTYMAMSFDYFKEKKNFISFKEAKIPIKVQLQNIGSRTINVQAVSYPGDVPRNALQLFKPNEVESKFKSNKYRASRGLSINNFFINKFGAGPPNKVILLTTGNNGGYINLVNPNFILGNKYIIYTSYKSSDGSVEKINYINFGIYLNEEFSGTFYYKIWIDFFPVVDSKHNYNFVNDTENNPIELLAEGSSEDYQTGLFHIKLPDNIQLGMNDGESKIFRLRVAISNEDNITQGGQFEQGEVEDYLIKIQAPTEAEIIAESATIAIPVRSGDQSGIDESPCGVPSEEPAPSPVAEPVNVGDATFPYSCNNFVCSGTDCDTNALNSTTPLEGNYSICISGLNDYIALDQGGTLLHESFNKRTISFWLNNTDNSGIENVYDEGGNTEGGMGIRINNDTEQIEVGVRNGTNLQTISATIPSTPWIHVVAIFDNGALSLYQNGTLSVENNNTGFSTIPQHTDEAGFGGTNGTNVFNATSKSYRGCVDEILIFDKALSSSEVNVLYHKEGIGSGNFKTSEDKKNQNSQQTENLIIYPNPSKGDVNLIAEVKETGTIKIQIIDLLGKVVYENIFNKVDTGFQHIVLKSMSIQTGTYIIKVANGGYQQTGILIMEK